MDHEIVSLLVNENDEERMLRHKGDLPTTKTDTNNWSADGDDYMSQNPTSRDGSKNKIKEKCYKKSYSN